MSITYVCSKIIKAININQHSTEFLWLCTVMPHAPCRWPMAHWSHWGTNSPNLGPAIIRGGWLSVTATCPIQGKLWSKISRKIRPEARGFAFARAGGCDDLNHLRFAPIWIVWVVWIASRSVSISQHLPKGREVRLIGLGLTNFTMFKTDQNR